VVCLYLGMSSAGFYAKPGIGFAFDSPSIMIENTEPSCGRSESVAFLSIGFSGVGAAGTITHDNFQYDSGWASAIALQFGLPDGKLGFGAGVLVQHTICL
jgi:hypothetical protein